MTIVMAGNYILPRALSEVHKYELLIAIIRSNWTKLELRVFDFNRLEEILKSIELNFINRSQKLPHLTWRKTFGAIP